ncbi:hypothetical protein PoB_003337400, partial [Plakobranchus ocellatus]
PQIRCPCGVAIVPDGSILVADAPTKTLHLVSSQDNIPDDDDDDGDDDDDDDDDD